MKRKLTKAALLLGVVVTLSTTGFAQEESKLKVERDDYQLKVKREGDEYKVKETGVLPVRHTRASAKSYSRVIKEGETITTEVKYGSVPEGATVAQTGKTVKKKSYASKKRCTCNHVAKRSSAKKRAVAYRHRAVKKATVAAVVAKPAPIVVRDTVLMVRVDTVFSVMEPTYYSGYRTTTRTAPAGLKKLKIEHEDGGVQVTEEHYDGRKMKKTFDSEEDFDTYMKWKYDE